MDRGVFPTALHSEAGSSSDTREYHLAHSASRHGVSETSTVQRRQQMTFPLFVFFVIPTS